MLDRSSSVIRALQDSRLDAHVVHQIDLKHVRNDSLIRLVSLFEIRAVDGESLLAEIYYIAPICIIPLDFQSSAD